MSDLANGLTNYLIGGLGDIADTAAERAELEAAKQKSLFQFGPEITEAKKQQEEELLRFRNKPEILRIQADGDAIKKELERLKKTQLDIEIIDHPLKKGERISRGDFYRELDAVNENKKTAFQLYDKVKSGLAAGEIANNEDNTKKKFNLFAQGLIRQEDLTNPSFVITEELDKRLVEYNAQMEQLKQTTQDNIKQDNMIKEVFPGLEFEVQTIQRFSGGKTTPLNKQEKLRFINDIKDSANGVERIILKEDTVNAINKAALNNPNIPTLNTNLPFLKMQTFKSLHKRSGATREMNSQDAVSYGRKVFSQFELFTSELLEQMDAGVKSEVLDLFANQLFIAKNTIAKRKGQYGAEEDYAVNLNALGLGLDNLSQPFLDVYKKTTGDSIRNEEKAVANVKNTNGDDVEVTNDYFPAEKDVKNTMFFAVVGSDDADADEIVKRGARKSYAIQNSVDINKITDAQVRSQVLANWKGLTGKVDDKGYSLVPTDAVGLVVSELLFDFLYPSGDPTTIVDMSRLTGSRWEELTDKMRLYALGYASRNRMAKLANVPMNLLEYERVLTDQLTLSINRKALLANENRLSPDEEDLFIKPKKFFRTEKEWFEANRDATMKKEADTAKLAGTNAIRASFAILRNFEQFGEISGSLPEGLVTILDDIKMLTGGGIQKINQVLKAEDVNNVFGKVDTILANYDGTDSNSLANLEMFDRLKKVNGGEGFRTEGISYAQGISQRRMLHSMLTFYAAAAFQGEGGKAISDGDRKFVEWALSYGVFTSAKRRKAAVHGLMAIISKATIINELISSDKIEDVYVGKNYTAIFGDNAISELDWPADLRKEVFGDNIPRNVNLAGHTNKYNSSIYNKPFTNETAKDMILNEPGQIPEDSQNVQFGNIKMPKDINKITESSANEFFDYMLDQNSIPESAVPYLQNLFTNSELIEKMQPNLVEQMKKKLATIGQDT